MNYYNQILTGLSVLTICAQVGVSTAAEDDALTVQSTGSEPVASVSGKTVTRDELTSFAIQLEQSEGSRVGGGEELLNEYILTELYDQIPTTASIEASDTDSAAPTEYRLVSQRGLLKRELRNWLSENIDLPREALEAWYESNVSKYEKPERVHAYHVFMETSEETPTSSPEQVRSRLQELKSQIDSGTSFSEIAREHSEAASSEAGGEIGLISRRMPIGPLSKPMNIELENAIFALTPGKVSDIVDTRHGMHLLFVTDRESTRTPTLDDMITSGILPGAVAQDRVTSQLQTLVQETVQKYQGKALPGGGSEITTDTVAFTIDGKNFTIGHLNSLFGPRFSRYLDSVKEDSEGLQTLMEQALEDEAMVRAAVDKGVAGKPEVARELEQLGKREIARERINAIAEAEARISDEDIRTRYEELKDQLRQPEAEGYVIMIQSEQATGTAEQARAREQAREKAEELRAQLTPENFTSVSSQAISRSDIQTSFSQVPRHVVGQSTDTMTRVFDQGISRISEESGISDVMPLSADFAIAYLVKRYPGEPVQLEVVEERLAAMLRNNAQGEVRRDMVRRLEEKGLVEYLRGASEFGRSQAEDADDTVTTDSADIGTTVSH